MKKAFTLAFLGLLLPTLLATSQETELFDQPLLITSAGQGAEVRVVQVLAKRAGLDSQFKTVAEFQDLENIKTLILVLGVSMKGLGAAGLDKDKEKERVSRLIEEAEKTHIPLLCLHLGGEARRGQLSDEFITAFLPLAKMAIVVKSGNKDGLLTKICQENDIPLLEVEKTVDILEHLKKSFRQ